MEINNATVQPKLVFKLIYYTQTDFDFFLSMNTLYLQFVCMNDKHSETF